MAITALPTPPSIADPVNFATRADPFNLQLVTFGEEANDLQADVNAKQVLAAASEAIATAAATAAASSALAAGATAWVSGTTYAIGDARYSLVNMQTYRRSTAGAGTTDPSADSANWTPVAALAVVTVISTSQTAVAGAHYALTNVAATTLTLPASPASGDTVAVTVDNALTTNVIARNGQTIMDAAEDMTIDNALATITFRFINSTWRII